MKAVPTLTYFRFNIHPHYVDGCHTELGPGVFDFKWKLDAEDTEGQVQTSVKLEAAPCTFPPAIADFETNLTRYVPEPSLLDSGWMPRPRVEDLLLDSDRRWLNRLAGFGRAGQFASFELVHDFPACCQCLGPLQGCRARRIQVSARHAGDNFPVLDVKASAERGCSGPWWTWDLSETVAVMPNNGHVPRQLGNVPADGDFIAVCGAEFAGECIEAHDDGVGRFHAEYDWFVEVECDCGRAPRPIELPSFQLPASGCVVHVTMAYNYLVNNRD